MTTTTLLCEEIEGEWRGRPILIDAEVTVCGDITREYPPTRMDPGEPAHFEGDIAGFHLVQVTDDGEPLPETVALFIPACAAVDAYLQTHRDALLDRAAEQVADEIEDAIEAAADRHIDQLIDAWRERRSH